MRKATMYNEQPINFQSLGKCFSRFAALQEFSDDAPESVKTQMASPAIPSAKSISSHGLRKRSAVKMDELLTRVAKRDREAFREVFDHFAPRIKAYIIGQGTDRQTAEEVVQETMVKIWRKAEQFDPARAAASTWIFTIARNMRVDHLRKVNRPEPDMDDPAFVREPEPLPSENLSHAQDSKILHTAIKKLPKEQQDVLRSAYFEEKTHPEIAEALNIPLGTVKSRVRLALKNIRAVLGEQI